MLESILSYAFFLQTVRITIPYLLPSLGGVFSEKGGVVNIALEGILLIGAFFTTVGTFYFNSVLIGILFGVLSGLAVALLHAIASVTFKANQIVSGIAINLFAVGLTKFFCKIIFNSSSNSERIIGLETINIPAIIISSLIRKPFHTALYTFANIFLFYHLQNQIRLAAALGW